MTGVLYHVSELDISYHLHPKFQHFSTRLIFKSALNTPFSELSISGPIPISLTTIFLVTSPTLGFTSSILLFFDGGVTYALLGSSAHFPKPSKTNLKSLQEIKTPTVGLTSSSKTSPFSTSTTIFLPLSTSRALTSTLKFLSHPVKFAPLRTVPQSRIPRNVQCRSGHPTPGISSPNLGKM
jgi:hypothetical protein